MKMPLNYCCSFRQEAYQVWYNMSETEKFGLSRNEETTTEDLLLNLARKHKGRGLDIKAYTKTKESRNGTDWAFWFTDGTWKGIGARIQAKRFFANEGRYKSLFHQSNKQKAASKATGNITPNQCETLLNYNDRSDPVNNLIPIYVFYNSDQLKLNICPSIYTQFEWSRFCGFPFFSPDWGITTTSALAIKNANWGRNNQPGDFPMIPWHCLVCGCCWDDCPVNSSLPDLVGYGLRQLYNYSISDREDDITTLDDLRFSFEPTDNTPKWVGLLREGREMEDRLEKEMDRLNLNGVTIIGENRI